MVIWKESILFFLQVEEIPLFPGLGANKETFLFVFNCESVGLFGYYAVVKGTHIPKSTVHAGGSIPPTLLLRPLVTDKTKRAGRLSHVWTFSPTHVSVGLSPSVCPSSCCPVSVPLSLLFESSLPCWISSLCHPRRPWNSCLAKCDNHFWEVTGCEIKGEIWANFESSRQSTKEDNKTFGKPTEYVTFSALCKRT